MTLANVSNQLLKSQGNDTTTVAANYPITGDGSTQLPLGLAEDYSGADGESLTFNITDIDNGHQVNISGIQGSSSFNVLNGQDGANGVNGVNGADGQSVTFDITNIANGHRVTLSCAQVSTSFDVMNGQNGVDGISPTFRFVENEDSVIVFVSGAQGEESFTLYNTTGSEGATYSAGPNINITDNTISGRDWSDEINAKLDTTAFSLPNSATWDDTYNTVNSNSATWNEVNEYTAGQNINITDNVISGKDWSDELNAKLDTTSFTLPTSALWDNTYNTVLANSAAWNEGGGQGSTYTAGPNININDNTISGKDWTAEIESAISSVSSNYYPMTGNPSGFLTAHQDITNLPYVQNIALNYTPSTLVSGISGHELYAESANHAFNAETAKYVESGWEYSDNKITAYNGSAFSAGSTYDVTAGANINVSTAGNTFGISGKDWNDTITAASAYAASQAQGKTYTGVAPIVVNNSEDKISANCIELSAGNGIDSDKLATGVIEVSSQGGVAISGQYINNDSTVKADCSAFGMYEQHNSPGSYQLIATANNASWHGYGYTLSTPENLLMDNVSSVAQNYAASAVSSHIRLIHYPDITFSAVSNTFKAGGIVVPYETTQGYSTFYNFVSSSVADSTSSYKFNYIGTNGYATILTVSSHYNGAVTGVDRAYRHIFLSPSECECKVVLVATSGDIPASGESDNKVYIVTGTA